MTEIRTSAVEGVPAEDDLNSHLETFLQALAALHYRRSTRHGKRRTVEKFLRWTRDIGIAAIEFDEELVDKYLKCVLGQPYRRGSKDRAALHQFLDHLRGIGVVPPRRDRAPTPAEVLTARYVEFLRGERGLSEHSVAVYEPFVREFVVAENLAEGHVCLDAAAVRRHLLGHSQGRSFEYTRLLATSLRSFLRFLFLRGETGTDLSEAVPPTRRWQAQAVPALNEAASAPLVLRRQGLTRRREGRAHRERLQDVEIIPATCHGGRATLVMNAMLSRSARGSR